MILTVGEPDLSLPIIAWRNVFAGATVEDDIGAVTYEPGFPPPAIVTYSTYEGAAASGGIGPLTIDPGETVLIDYFAFSSVLQPDSPPHTLTISTSGTPDDEDFTQLDTWTDVRYPLLVLLETPVSARRVRIQMTAEFAGNVMAGRRLQVQRPVYVGHEPVRLNRRTVSTGPQSENGQYLGKLIRSESLRTQLDLTNLSPAWVREHLDPFVAAARDQPFYLAWRPSEIDDVAYCWLESDPQIEGQRVNGMMRANMRILATSR